MEYNTQREPLKITDYGRNVVKLIEKCKEVADREERTKMANMIVDVMAQVNPKAKERSDYRHTLWDHMMFLANYELDVDAPYPITREEPIQMHPTAMRLPETKIHYRHYGRALEDMIAAVAQMADSDERTQLTKQIANTMKRQYLQWNRDSVDDDLIKEQLAELSGGRLTLPDDFTFRDSQEYLAAMAAAQAKKASSEGNKKKKKKKKKQQQQQ